MALNELAETDKLIEDRFRRHRNAEVITSMPGIDVLLGAEFLAATGGDMGAFASADRLASFAGVSPVPREWLSWHSPAAGSRVLWALLRDGRCYGPIPCVTLAA